MLESSSSAEKVLTFGSLFIIVLESVFILGFFDPQIVKIKTPNFLIPIAGAVLASLLLSLASAVFVIAAGGGLKTLLHLQFVFISFFIAVAIPISFWTPWFQGNLTQRFLLGFIGVPLVAMFVGAAIGHLSDLIAYLWGKN